MVERSYNEYRTMDILEVLNTYREDILYNALYEYEDEVDQICAVWAMDEIIKSLEDNVNLPPLQIIECCGDVWGGWAAESTGEQSKKMFGTAAEIAYCIHQWLSDDWWKGEPKRVKI